MSTMEPEFTMRTDRKLIPIERACRRVVELEIQAPETQAAPDPAAPNLHLNLAVVIDRSGSMSGQKIEYARQAAIHLVDSLQDGDRIAVVAYDDEVTAVAPSTLLSHAARADLRARIAALRPGGSTNLSGGWLQGCQEVAAAGAGDGYLNRALLISDGLANCGITDIEELGYHSRQIHARGVSTSTFGVGADFDENLLELIANQGGGNFYYIESPNRIPEIFAAEFKEVSTVTAYAVEVMVNLPQGVQAEVPGGWKQEIQPTAQGSALRLYLGDLPATQRRGIFLYLAIPPQGGTAPLEIEAVLRCKNEAQQVVEKRAACTLQPVPAEQARAEPAERGSLERFSLVQASEAASQAHRLEKMGRLEEASRLIEAALESFGDDLPPDKLEYFQHLAERIRRGRGEVDRKTSHYRSYLDKQTRSQRD